MKKQDNSASVKDQSTAVPAEAAEATLAEADLAEVQGGAGYTNETGRASDYEPRYTGAGGYASALDVAKDSPPINGNARFNGRRW
ncbi:MAG TPA: hypothetical protein VGF45_07490 [Polyangia bacterium]